MKTYDQKLIEISGLASPKPLASDHTIRLLAVSDRDAIWAGFHRAWSACVGRPEYDKKVWKAAERQLLEALSLERMRKE